MTAELLKDYFHLKKGTACVIQTYSPIKEAGHPVKFYAIVVLDNGHIEEVPIDRLIVKNLAVLNKADLELVLKSLENGIFNGTVSDTAGRTFLKDKLKTLLMTNNKPGGSVT